MKQEKNRLDYQPPKYKILDVYLEFLLDPHNTRVSSTLKIEKNGDHTDPLVLDGEKLKLESVLLDSNVPKYEVTDKNLIIKDVPNSFELKIVNYIDPANNLEFEGLYMSDGAFCTQNEAEGFRKITYYLDRPDVSAKFTTKIIAKKDDFPYLLSNGNRVEQGDLSDGYHYVVRQDPYSKPSYLFALVAGKFDVVEDHFVTKSGRDIEIQLFVDVGNYDRGIHAVNSIKKAMKWDEDRFDLEYDLDLFQVVAVDFFNMGAMENKGLNIFNSKFVLADPKTATDTDYDNIESVIGHEYFHNWTGDRVTCRDWFQLSLKEGLTVFRDQEFSSDVSSRSVHRIQAVKVVRGAQFAEDLSPMAHSIRPDHVYEQNNFYTVTVYDKGAEVIRMIHSLLGEKAFQSGMKLYISRFDGGCATCEDFVKAMEDASGEDLSQFRNWYSFDGTPVVTPLEKFDSSKKEFTIKLTQDIPSTVYKDRSKYPNMVIPLRIEILNKDGSLINFEDQNIKNDLYILNQKEQTITLKNISERPIVNYLGDFSAPIKINKIYSSNDLLISLVNTKNDFNRYEALWQLYSNYFHDYIDHNKVDCSSIVKGYELLLKNESIDKLFLAEILAIPTENQIAEMFEQVDIDKIHLGRGLICKHLANDLYDLWEKVYQDNYIGKEPYSIDQSCIAKRALANLALYFIAEGKGNEVNNLIKDHYFNSNNMTDTLASMQVAVKTNLFCSQELLDDYDSKWNQNGLVMDKWFSIQATAEKNGLIENIKKLMNHKSFSMNNPNRVRALIGSFAFANPYIFHSIDGSGYKFLTEMLKQLNNSNPQTAARIIEPMIKYSRLDMQRQELIKSCLNELFSLPNLCSDLYEKIAKALKK